MRQAYKRQDFMILYQRIFVAQNPLTLTWGPKFLMPSIASQAGNLALELGVEAGPQMTYSSAVVKMMFCLAHPDIALGVPIAGEL
jgi:hypothetical protein